jgi:hypothetical protein
LPAEDNNKKQHTCLTEEGAYGSISDEELFHKTAESVHKARADVQAFIREMQSPEMTDILQRAALSRQQNPASIWPWRMHDHPDWDTPGHKERRRAAKEKELTEKQAAKKPSIPEPQGRDS